MFKRLTILALAGGVAASLAGCASDGPGRPTGAIAPGPSLPAGGPGKALAAAEALRARGAFAEALDLLAAAHERFPGHAAITSAYGRTALLLGRDELAASLLREAIAADPRDWRALSALGVLESRQGRGAEGRRVLTEASAVSANPAISLNNLAVSHLLDGQAQEAAALLRRALTMPDLDPAHQRRLRRNLALALAVQGSFEEADSLAGERMPRELAGADSARLRRFMGIGETVVAAESGWKAGLADYPRPAQPALR